MIDPLEATDVLAGEIAGTDGQPAQHDKLIRAIDMFVFSLHFAGSVPGGKGSAQEPSRPDYARAYEHIAARFPQLGHYWVALHCVVQDGVEGEAALADAIDDLTDILTELGEVQWLRERCGRPEALAALRAKYDTHLWMHLHSLRQYLQEVTGD